MSGYRDEDRAMRYPGPRDTYALDPDRRGPFGTLAKWSWIGFNGIMLVFVALPLIIVKTFESPTNSEVLAGYLGSALLLGGAFSFWLVTNLFLGAIVWMTRPD